MSNLRTNVQCDRRTGASTRIGILDYDVISAIGGRSPIYGVSGYLVLADYGACSAVNLSAIGVTVSSRVKCVLFARRHEEEADGLSGSDLTLYLFSSGCVEWDEVNLTV